MLITNDSFTEITNGNGDAKDFCIALFSFCHLLDDFIDKDKPVDASQAVLITLKLIGSVATNPFFQANSIALMGAIHTAGTAYLASLSLEASKGIVNLAASQFLKSAYQEVFFLAAFLCGGIDHQLAMDLKYRGYSIDEPVCHGVLGRDEPQVDPASSVIAGEVKPSGTEMQKEMADPSVEERLKLVARVPSREDTGDSTDPWQGGGCGISRKPRYSC